MLKSTTLMLCLASVLLASCSVGTITGSGNVVTREEAITGFDKVDISQAFEAEISQGDAFSVVIRVDDNIVKYLQVVRQGKTLKIGLKPNHPRIRNATQEAEVTMPALTGLDMSGASSAFITGFKSTQALYVDLSGSSRLQGDIEAGNAGFDLSGSSEVLLSGSAQNIKVEASGSSEIDLTGLASDEARVNVSGGSEAIINASGKLDVDASGASKVSYLGSPTLGRTDTSGSSSIERR